MPKMAVSAKVAEAQLAVEVDPLLNSTLGAFFKAGAVATAKVAAEETYSAVKRGSVSQHNFEGSLKKMCKEGAYWGTVAGVYGGVEYGLEKIRGTRDWKNAMIGGALTGALISAANSKNRDQIVTDAITGGAVATAAHLLL